MSIDISRLESVRERGEKVIARCPACAEAGHDQKGEHLVINKNGGFGCVLYPGDSADAKQHRKRIFALCGDRAVKALVVHSNQPHKISRLCGMKVKKGVLSVLMDRLGRQGRVFQPLAPIRERKNASADTHAHSPREIEKGVLSVLPGPTVTRAKRLSESVPIEQRLYVIQDRDGDFISDVVETEWTTVPLTFKWTKDFEAAKRFSSDQLHARGATITLAQRIIQGHGGTRQIRVR
jgi:hypothetical protein